MKITVLLGRVFYTQRVETIRLDHFLKKIQSFITIMKVHIFLTFLNHKRISLYI